MKHHYLADGEDFLLSVHGDTKFFNRDLKVTVNNREVKFGRTAKSEITVKAGRFTVGAENVLTLTSSGVTIDRHVLHVRRRVRKPKIEVNRLHGSRPLNVKIQITVQPADHMWLTFDSGVGPLKQEYLPLVTSPETFPDHAHFSDLGDYVMTVRVENEVSSESVTAHVSVEVPLRDFHLSTQNVTSLTEDAVFELDVNRGLNPPQKVVFSIDYGDGDVQEIFHRNEQRDRFETFTLRHRYQNWGIYRVHIRASNNISSLHQDAVIQVGENLTSIDILTERERVDVLGTLQFAINCPTGSDVTYLVDFGDGTNFTVNELTGPSPSNHTVVEEVTEVSLLLDHTYVTEGQYDVTVSAENAFGVMTTSLCPRISVASLVDSWCDPPDVQILHDDEPVAGTLERMRSEVTTLTVDATNNCEGNTTTLTYSWKAYRVVDTEVEEFSSIFLYCDFKKVENELVIQPRDLEFGFYRIYVTVSPEDQDLTLTSEYVDLEIVQSPPVSVIQGKKEEDVMLYSNAIFNISGGCSLSVMS